MSKKEQTAQQQTAQQPPAPAKVTGLVWVGERLPDGRPVQWIDGIPARDLGPADLATLTDEQIERALASGLYRRAKEA